MITIVMMMMTMVDDGNDGHGNDDLGDDDHGDDDHDDG